MSTIGLIVLAAGASTRMGTPKQLLTYQGRSFLGHTVEAALASFCHPIVVVLGARAEQIKPEVSQLAVQVVENPAWSQGMGTSIAAGMKALNASSHLEAVAIVLCDQPFISCQIINQLIEVYRLSNKLIVASEYAGTLGVPALFSHTVFSELMSLQATEGAKQLISKYAREVIGVPFPQGAIDIDTPKDYEQLQIEEGRRQKAEGRRYKSDGDSNPI